MNHGLQTINVWVSEFRNSIVVSILLYYSLTHTLLFRLELVSKELNHLAAILHVYAGGLNFMK